MKAVKTICWPTNKKKLQTRELFYYVKIRKISSDFANLINDYEMKRKNLLQKKSVWAKNIPVIKCNPEPISQAEYQGAVRNCIDYHDGLINVFYSYQCTLY
jgi:hypothetical protein